MVVASRVGCREAIAEIDTRVVEGSLGADFNSHGVEIGASVRTAGVRGQGLLREFRSHSALFGHATNG
jgi:hypothetical protein